MTRVSRRRLVVGMAGLGLLAGCGRLPWQAQEPARVPRVGYLALNNTPVAEIEAFRDGLRELSYLEGRTTAIDVRLAESTKQFPALAVELVGLPVDLIVSAGGRWRPGRQWAR